MAIQLTALSIDTINGCKDFSYIIIPKPPLAASLTIISVIAANNLSARILDAWSSKLSIAYLQQRLKWSIEIINMVDWEHLDVVLTRIYKSNFYLFNHIVKFMIDIPHTSHQKARFTSK